MTQNYITLQTLETSLRAAGRHGRTTITQDHFESFISPSPAYHLSFAVPILPNPSQWETEIQQLKQNFAKHDRQIRLEYMAELHPHLAPALASAGLVEEMRAPVMTLAAEQLPISQLPYPAGYRRFESHDEIPLRSFLMGQAVAYGGQADESALAWLPSMISGLEKGTVMAAGIQCNDKFLAGASIQIGDSIGELAGVWTDPTMRKQGLAYGVCHALLQNYMAAGYKRCWLSAAEGALRLYEKLGFERAGTQLNFGLKK